MRVITAVEEQGIIPHHSQPLYQLAHIVVDDEFLVANCPYPRQLQVKTHTFAGESD